MTEISLIPNWQAKHRARTLNEIVGQEKAQRLVHGMFKTGQVPQTILIAGDSGSGKTTLAWLIAKRLCPNGQDIFDSNAAEDTGVDIMREKIESARMKPMHGKFKVYIMDEAHGLTKQSASAALSFLEKPPEHVVVIMTTNQPKDMLETLRDRATRIDLQPLSEVAIYKLLTRIAIAENVFQPLAQHDAVFKALARMFNGSARPAIDALYNLHLIEQSRPLKREDLANEITKVLQHDYKDSARFVSLWYKNDKSAMQVVGKIQEPSAFVTLLLKIHDHMLRKAIGLNPPFDYLAMEASKGLSGVSVTLLHENMEILLELRRNLNWTQGRNVQHLLLSGILKLKGPPK